MNSEPVNYVDLWGLRTSDKDEISQEEVEETFAYWLSTTKEKYYPVAYDVKVYLENQATLGNRPTEVDIFVEAEKALFGQAVYATVGSVAVALTQIKSPLEKLLNETTPGRITKGRTTQYVKSGTYDNTVQDFNSLNPSNVKPIETRWGAGQTGTLSDGRNITARPGSTFGTPTLEIRNTTNGRGIEIRYGK